LKERVFISGASSGIGLSLAEVFAAKGHGLFLAARKPDALAKAADALRKYGTSVLYEALDMTDDEAVNAMFAKWQDDADAPGIFINNAGCGYYGPFDVIPQPATDGMIDLNILALTRATVLETRLLRVKGGGHIMNVASTASFQPGPFSAVYYASKSYVLNFSIAARRELRDSGIIISLFCPGPTRTPFHAKAGLSASRPVRMMEPHKAAEHCYKAFIKGKAVIIPGLRNKILVSAGKILPRRLLLNILEKVNAKYQA